MFTNRLFYLLIVVGLLVVTACAPQSVPTIEVSESIPAISPTVTPAKIPPQMTPTQAGPSFPVISTSEPWIATQPHRQHLLLVRPDGSNPKDILTHLPQEQLHPDWSPDGSQLVFEHMPKGPEADVNEIWISDANGDNARPLLREYPTDLERLYWANPAWSRDGIAIAMVGYKGNAALTLPTRSVIVIVNIASGNVSVVGEYQQSSGYLHSVPRWSPDGKALVFVLDHFDGEEFLGGAIAIIRRTYDGWSEPTLITEVGDWTDRPDWHPTDDLIVFCTYDYNFGETDEPSNLFTIRPDGMELTQITNFSAGEERATQPTWTYDGRIIFTYVSGANDEKQSPAFINADGSGLEVLTGPENLVHSRLRPIP